MKFFILQILLFLSAIGLQGKPIKVMLLTGHTDKYHNWQVTSSHLKAILDNDSIFKTDVILIPQERSELENFNPDFSAYQVIVLNLNAPYWSGIMKIKFEKYVRNGGGVVVIHEANNAFPDWKEYNMITGLGGWGNRDEKAGPYYYWKNGKYVTENSPGIGGWHGDRVPFVIQVRDSLHPITKGIPTKWLHQNDELYGNLRGPAFHLHVLATAFSTKETKGTGKEEPVLFTITYGRGRIFHSVLGHTGSDFSDSVQDVGFQVTFSRGVEWVATGKVNQKPPVKFPTENSVLLKNLIK